MKKFVCQLSVFGFVAAALAIPTPSSEVELTTKSSWPTGPPPWVSAYPDDPVHVGVAMCHMQPAAGWEAGNPEALPSAEMYLHQVMEDGPVFIVGSMRNLPPGLHGLHVHEHGTIAENCTAAGPHYNPDGKKHGGPGDSERHIGDMGNVLAEEDGIVRVSLTVPGIAIVGDTQRNIMNRTLVLHLGEDDLGRGEGESQANGNSGARVACCVVEKTKPPEGFPAPVGYTPE